MLPSFETLELEIEDKVATVTLNRPDKSNAMNTSMWADIHNCFDWLDSELSVRAVVLAGAGWASYTLEEWEAAYEAHERKVSTSELISHKSQV